MSQTIQQVVILAGGLGTRLGELSRQTPKPVIPVAGKPYLEWQIELLRGHGLREFLLLTGYRAEQIEAYFGDGSRWQVSISYSREPEPLGTAAALKLAEPKLRDRFLLMNGDTFFPFDYTAFVRQAETQPHCAWLVAVPRRALGTNPPRGNVGLDADAGQVVEYVRGGRDGLDFVHAGIFVLDRSWLTLMRGGQGQAIEAALCPPLLERGLLRAFVCRERFYDMGTPQQLQELENFLKSYHGRSK
jgi:NDP-sugar pyrophosphorylase family protein